MPEKCRWCYRAADGSDTLNPFDKSHPRRAGLEVDRGRRLRELGDRLRHRADLGARLLAGAAAYDGAASGAALDVLLVGEAVVVAQSINQVAKFALARERPFVHYLPSAPDGVRELTASPSDDNLSFFSGHSTLAFSIATSSATVATLRGYRLAPVLWASGLAQAAAVAYLRIGADKHYFSDVMLGALVGSAIGIGLPMLFHRPRGRRRRRRPAAASPRPARRRRSA